MCFLMHMFHTEDMHMDCEYGVGNSWKQRLKYTWNSAFIQMHGHIGYADKCMFMLETFNSLCLFLFDWKINIATYDSMTQLKHLQCLLLILIFYNKKLDLCDGHGGFNLEYLCGILVIHDSSKSLLLSKMHLKSWNPCFQPLREIAES